MGEVSTLFAITSGDLGRASRSEPSPTSKGGHVGDGSKTSAAGSVAISVRQKTQQLYSRTHQTIHIPAGVAT